ncbi:MAG: DUF386 domain-containing protein [Bacteroidales bacterium]|nr:DUF386 domain-containing protein [Bacteroidales bacterium]
MVLDSLKNSGAYTALHPLFKQAFDYLNQHDLSAMEPGKTVLIEGKLTLSIMEVEGKTPEAAKLEAHERYIDIQTVISGTEAHGWLPIEACKQEKAPYDAEKDIVFFTDTPSTQIAVKPGEFVIFFPEDGHAPCIGEGPIKKAVFKVLV